jgi:hypothetical protein
MTDPTPEEQTGAQSDDLARLKIAIRPIINALLPRGGPALAMQQPTLDKQQPMPGPTRWRFRNDGGRTPGERNGAIGGGSRTPMVDR